MEKGSGAFRQVRDSAMAIIENDNRVNKMKKKRFVILVAILTIIAFAAVVSAAEKKYSGFLGKYDGLKKGPKDGVAERYLKKGVDFRKYNKIMLDSVVFFLAEDAEYKGISAEDMKELTDTFNKAAVEALGKSYPLVGEAGPDVIRVRVAITKLKPSKPGSATMTTVMPVGLALSFIKKGTTGEFAGVGSTGIEAEILDSLTNEQIGAAVDYKPGGKMSGFARWSASREAFEFWTARLKAFLDDAHGVGPKAK
jgi:hypothetical protein